VIGSAGRSDCGTDGDLSLFLLAGGADGAAAGAPSADDCAYWVSVMVRIGLGREVGAVSYGLVSRLLGGAGTVQVGSGSA
jgi:hypothetical protein